MVLPLQDRAVLRTRVRTLVERYEDFQRATKFAPAEVLKTQSRYERTLINLHHLLASSGWKLGSDVQDIASFRRALMLDNSGNQIEVLI